MKTIFKKGDRVFDYIKGWGEIVHTYSDNWEKVDDNYTVCVVKFDSSKEIIHFTKYLATKMLSFTEYTLQGFTQEKPVNYEEYVGKWGKFWDYDFKKSCIIGKLCRYHSEDSKPFKVTSLHFEYFEPLSEEQIKTLNLE